MLIQEKEVIRTEVENLLLEEMYLEDSRILGLEDDSLDDYLVQDGESNGLFDESPDDDPGDIINDDFEDEFIFNDL